MLNLPFDLDPYLESGEPLVLGDLIRIPRYGSVTVREYLLLDSYYTDLKNTGATQLELTVALATILIQSRFDHGWQVGQTCKLPTHWIEQLAEFLLNEQHRWQPPRIEEEGNDAAAKKLIGHSATGESSSIIPTSPDLAEETLQTVPSG